MSLVTHKTDLNSKGKTSELPNAFSQSNSI